jgi:hypothetical protein
MRLEVALRYFGKVVVFVRVNDPARKAMEVDAAVTGAPSPERPPHVAG